MNAPVRRSYGVVAAAAILGTAAWGALLLSLDGAAPLLVHVGAWVAWPILAALAALGFWRWHDRIARPRKDRMTGLPSSGALVERLDIAIAQAKRSQRLVAVLLVDLDRLHAVNESLGRRTGDAVIQLAAARLSHTVRETDAVIRLDGDTFALIAPDTETAESVGGLARRVLESLRQPYGTAGGEVHTTASIGIALFPSDATESEFLVERARRALRTAKAVGRDNYRYHATADDAAAHRRAKLEMDLRAALARDELLMHYQPQVNLVTGEVTGVEALMRWPKPPDGWVSPEEFIRVAEQCSLILPLGSFALRTAAAQARAWTDAGLTGVRVAVNLSVAQFRNQDLVAEVREALADAGMTGDCLEVELTESVLMEDTARITETLERLRDMGVKVAIDDFGTGYSSLSYLQQLPADRLKIDRSLINGVCNGGADAAVVRAVIELARSLEMEVVAEGVETAQVAEFLRRLGCTEAQGYFYARPVPAADLPKALDDARTAQAAVPPPRTSRGPQPVATPAQPHRLAAGDD